MRKRLQPRRRRNDNGPEGPLATPKGRGRLPPGGASVAHCWGPVRRLPLPGCVALQSVWWTAPVSNRAGAACKAALRSSAQPIFWWIARDSNPACPEGRRIYSPVQSPALLAIRIDGRCEAAPACSVPTFSGYAPSRSYDQTARAASPDTTSLEEVIALAMAAMAATDEEANALLAVTLVCCCGRGNPNPTAFTLPSRLAPLPRAVETRAAPPDASPCGHGAKTVTSRTWWSWRESNPRPARTCFAVCPGFRRDYDHVHCEIQIGRAHV